MSRPLGTGGRTCELRPQGIQYVVKILAKGNRPKRDLAVFFIGLGGGLRIGEICSLRVGDVFHGGRVLGEIHLDRHKTKNGRTRTVALAPQAIQAIKTYLPEIKCQDPFAPPFAGRNPSLPLTSRHGIRILESAFELAGLARASSHSLRRTHANILRRSGADLRLVQDQLGHASLATTQVYLSVDPEEKRRAVSALNF